MPSEYQTGEDQFNISGIREALPDELSARYFQNYDKALERMQSLDLNRTLGGLSDAGFLRSGNTFTQVANNVLGPADERRASILQPELRNAANQGRDERLAGVAFDRQNQQLATQHKYKLEELSKQAQVQQMLMELENSLNNQGGFDWGGLAGTVVGGFAGSLAGGVGGAAGAQLGSQLFSSKPQAPGYNTR
jgi:hypothetical protein